MLLPTLKYTVLKKLAYERINYELYLNLQVILESLRMASIISFTFREAVVDVEYKGGYMC